ncbi:MAG: cytidine deaminase [Holophagales bacterium]|nr:MAG: cytidine deaminase [Holophagales bacterium]
MDWKPLLDAAFAARRNAHAPYSGFKVGAALLCEDGTIVAGCNVENRSYGLTICAERNAITTAAATGHRRFRAVAIVADSDPLTPPCGMCRESLQEFCDDLPILLANLRGEQRETTLRVIFPEPFVFAPPAG